MTGFAYRHGRLHADAVDLGAIAESAGTPCYVYSATQMADAYRAFAGAFADVDALVCYALKANGNLAVIRTFAALGAGADVVSEGELARARAAGVDAQRIVFAGVGKTARELAAGLEAGILQFNVESEPELIALDQIARDRGVRAPVAIRVNPDVDANTHAKISTGLKHNKFGIDIDRAEAVFALARDLPGIAAHGVAVHIGSQLTDLEPFRAAFTRVAELVHSLRAAGHTISELDLGGGLGISYRGETPPPVGRYAEMAKAATRDLGCRLVLEPGRHLVGNAGVLLTRVIYVKQGADRTFVITDAAMNDLVRPAMYDAYHSIEPVIEPAQGAPRLPVDIVGPVCETGDMFASDRPLPPVAAGDLLAIRSAGAYGAVMASTYNARPLPPEVLVRDRDFAVIKPRATLAELYADERLPNWLDAPAAAAKPGKAQRSRA
jgi:diaminopimelate decarboxylase